MRRFAKLFGGLLGAMMLCASCAVHWSLRNEPREKKKVYLPLPDNTSMKTGIDHEYYVALRNRIAAIRELQLVDRKSDADQVLLIDFKEAVLRRGPTSFTGTSITESSGGLAQGAYTAASLILRVNVDLESRSPELGSLLWKRGFKKSIQFEASNRLLESEGASSAPMINESREIILHRQLAVDFARMAVDQLIEEF